jgi:hypothetical protein
MTSQAHQSLLNNLELKVDQAFDTAVKIQDSPIFSQIENDIKNEIEKYKSLFSEFNALYVSISIA